MLNAIVENRYEMALREAREIDEFLKWTATDEARIGREKPLLGVPVTVKESIAVQGTSLECCAYHRRLATTKTILFSK